MYHIVVNPFSRSGRGKRNWEKVKRILDEQSVDYEVHFTKKNGDAASLVRELYEKVTADGTKLELIILGGDGTNNEVIQGIPSFNNVTVSIIPSGSSNDLARALGISFVPEEAVMHLLTKPTTLFMDLGTIHMENTLVREGNMTIPDRRFLVSAGFGYDAAICHEANMSAIKSLLNQLQLGSLSYLAICLKQLISMKPVVAELTLDDNDSSITIGKLVLVAGMNNKFEGGGFNFGPDSSNHDGLIDLFVVSDVPKAKILSLLPIALRGEKVVSPGVEYYKAYQYSVRTSEPIWVHTDGEADVKADFIEVMCNKEVLRIIY